jgi:hypothetical protein
MPSSSDAPGAIRVAVVSANQGTLDDLERYLRDVGLRTSCSKHLGVALGQPPSVVALVVFPDDFLRSRVIATLHAVAKARPRVLSLLVTGEPGRYEHDLPDTEHILVMPRPVWAWAIYDAIRPRLGGTSR